MSSNNSLEDVLALAREDLACYAIAQWPQFELAHHHRVLIEALEAVERGEISRLMVFMPPRHGKSLISTQFFPAYYLGRRPDRSIATATYGQELSDEFGRKVRNVVTGERHQAIFPGFAVAGDSGSLRRFNTTAAGLYYAVGRGGPLTGRGADLLLIDDPLKDNEEARSETIRRSLHDWYSSTAYTRLQPKAAVVLIQTRWHEDDLAGWLLREHPEEQWHVISMPAIAEKDDSFRRAGEALWPDRFPLPVLEQIRLAIGGAMWSSLYQQRPSAAEGAVFKREWWQSYATAPTLKRKIQSWDTAFKTGTENDFSVCTTWGVAENGYYLLGLWKGRVEFPELKRIFKLQADEWTPNAILVEDKASGQSLIQELKLATALPVIPIKVDSDKLTRAQAVTPLLEAGKVYLPEGAPWRAEYLDELASFPTAAHDDAVDSTTQALNYLRQQTPSIIEFYRGARAKAEKESALPSGSVRCDYCKTLNTAFQIRYKKFCCPVFQRQQLEAEARNASTA
jgi:predicted phage terminase large subunit-like protein